VAGASLTYRLRLALAAGDQTLPALAKALNAEEATIGRLIRRLRERGEVIQYGELKPYLWRLVRR
jgi:hypothetical protein